ncbi:MAG TPA: DUF962 domain-containing protein [Bacteriovoracaceae bacterium]|nr:DUF962 domain-containing protein [Bacteriovoracaceae bacterium]
MNKEFQTFSDFYPFYLKQHRNLLCRRFHFFGTCGVFALLVLFFFTGNIVILALLPLTVYGVSWVGHWIFEKRSPIFYRHPYFSLLGDFRMFWDILAGRVKAF